MENSPIENRFPDGSGVRDGVASGGSEPTDGLPGAVPDVVDFGEDESL